MSASTVVSRQESIRTDYVSGWKDRGGKVVAYSCCATPVEILDAAGVLPYRLKALGNPDTYLADAELSTLNCSFCRACLQLGLDGTYDFLDGLIETNGCDHMRCMFENWNRIKGPGLFHYFRVPHFLSAESLDYFEEEMRGLRDALAGHFSANLADELLLESMERQNRVRQALRELNALREREKPAVTGSEMLALMVRGSSMRAEDFLKELEALLAARKGAGGQVPKARLMMCGSVTDEVAWYEEIEKMGALVVADAQCYGARAFCQDYELGGDPMRTLAESYLSDLMCPRMYTEYPKRRDFMLRTARRAGIDGVVILYNKFCDLHGVDGVLLQKDFRKAGIPALLLEKEYRAAADIGRVRTRLQAFMEMMAEGGV